MRALPTGTVTFLFTDVEGSTKLLHELGAERYAEALLEHRRVLREAFERHGGVEVDTQGDAFFVAFPTPPGALAAAAQACDALELGRIRVRIGIHTGAPLLTDEGYVGSDVHKGARIAAAGHGGQVLVSSATAALLEAEKSVLLDLGEHRLKDLSAPERIYQAGHGDFPPLKTLYQTNLPVPATSFLGRERELAEIGALLERQDLRLLTLTGPGGTGKTRLALQAAAAASERYPDGVFWVPLAPLRDPALVTSQAAQALGATDGLAEYVADRRLLLVLDNLEHLIKAADDLARLLPACPNLELLVTSREVLRIPGEQVYPVPPLAPQEGTALFLTRARAADPTFAPSPAADELCARLDNLPLALELAAARVTVLSPEQLLERLSTRLDLLKAGRGVDPHQQTLRVTIEWSHELLNEDEMQLFAALAVFRGGCTIEAAEDVCGADLDVLQSLVDKSLVRRNEGRFWMLETIRQFADEQLAGSPREDEVRRRLAAAMLALAREAKSHLVAGDQEEWLRRIEAEMDNIRAALEWALVEHHDREVGRELASSLGRFWWARAPREGLAWLERVLEQPDLPLAERASALDIGGGCAWFLGDHVRAQRLFEQSLALYRELGDREGIGMLLTRLAPPLIVAGRREEAEALAAEAVAIQRDLGNTSELPLSLHILGSVALERGDWATAADLLEESLGLAREAGDAWMVAGDSYQLAEAALQRGDPQSAWSAAREGLAVSHGLGDQLTALICLGFLAAAAAQGGERRLAGLLWGAAERLDEDLGESMWRRERRQVEERLTQRGADFEQGVEEGRELGLDEAVALALDRVEPDGA